MIKLINALLTVLILSFTAQAQLSGALSGILAGDSTYTVVGNISVEDGDSLIIEAGAILIFNEGFEFDINGYLHAAGTETDSVKFINSPGITWGGIDINDSADDSSILEYCLITGGQASGSWPNYNGGGIICDYSNPAITNCTISGNTASSGGGIYCYYSTTAITNCTISGNSGGGICCYSSNSAITNCTINENTASAGGGIYCYASNTVITGYTINENTAGVVVGFFVNSQTIL